MKELKKLFYPQSIAVIGASKNPLKWGFVIPHNILMFGYRGKLFLVNPHEEEIFGLKVYRNVLELPEVVDLAIITVPEQSVSRVLEECVLKGIRNVFCITSGFGETGEEGKKKEGEIRRFCEDKNLIFAGPNGQGIVSTEISLCAQMSSIMPPKGRISIISQSGNIGATIMGFAAYYNTGISKFISSGNEAVLTTTDYLEYLGEDENTGVILLYVESLKDGRRFLDVAERVSLKKPVILLKGGVTRSGISAAGSHTGAIAGNEGVFDAAIRQAGIIRVYTIEELFDIASAFVVQPLPGGRRVGIISMGGGWAVLAADICSKLGLDVVSLLPETIAKIDPLLPPFWSKGNPVDLVGVRESGVIYKSVRALLSAHNIDAVLVMGVGYNSKRGAVLRRSPFYEKYELEKVCQLFINDEMENTEYLIKDIKEQNKPIILCSDVSVYGRALNDEAFNKYLENGIFIYPTPERGARVLAHLVTYSEYLRKKLPQTKRAQASL